VVLDLATVQTNIIVFGLTEDAPDANVIVAGARRHGVLIYAFGPKTIRAVTHLDVSRQQCERAAEILVELING
jgi:threonine aldolase